MSDRSVRIFQLKKKFGAVAAVDSISLDINAGEFFSLLGPSGCGKTTLLRLVAGLEQPDSGTIAISGKEMTHSLPQTRPVNMVFQNYALFPHLNVAQNVAFGLRMRGINSAEIGKRSQASMEMVQIAELSKRFPHQLSGGQKQRVALARALINEPEVLLLDEPLAAIDAKLRKQLQSDLKELQRKLGTTFIYVTHDQDEALSMSDRIALLRAGKIEQLGTPEDVYERPATQFAASFLGSCNLFQATLDAPDILKTDFGRLRVKQTLRESSNILAGIRPEKIQLSPTGESENCFMGIITKVTYSGARTEVTLKIGHTAVYLALLNSVDVEPLLQSGAQLKIFFPPSAIFAVRNEP
jgi:spermidine/putrescine transport system ATP-binding protein